ncbi:hypothetical protein BH09VER1_BH09VER1_27440 [soil metagenome]
MKSFPFSFLIPKRSVALALGSAGAWLLANSSFAQSGTWNVNANGLWSTTGNWAAGVVATGSDNTADFGQVDLTADRTVTLDSARTIGNLIFADSATATAFNWILTNGGTTANILTLAGTAPTITVNALGSAKTATIGLELAGTQGLIKAGTGTLVLTGSNSYSGGTTINAGLLQVGSGGTAGVLGSGTVNVNVAANVIGLQFNRSDAFTVSNVIAGTGRVGIAGTGTTIFTGSNTYSSFTVLSNGATLQGSVATKYLGNQTVTSVFGTNGVVALPSGTSSIQLRANGQDDGTIQTLTFNYQLQAANGGTLNIDVNREASSTGSNKIISLTTANSLNFGLPASGTSVINLTGGNGYSLAAPTITMGNASSGSYLLNPTTANFLVTNATSSGVGTKTLIFGGTSSGNVVSGTISNGSGTVLVTKSDVGTWTLSGTSTYTGATTVTAGTLVVGVSGTGAITGSAVTVNAGTLAGTGRITNAVTVGDGTGSADAIIAAGNGGIGTISTGTLSMLSDAQFKFELNSSTVQADQLNVTGAVTINSSAVFSFTDLGSGTLALNTVFTLIANDFSDAISGAFSNLAQGSTFTSGNNTYQASYIGGTGNDLTLTVVPEPTTWALLAGGLTMLVVFRGRRRVC